VSCLDEHPNIHEILSILARVPQLTDHEIARLANGWRDNSFLASARNRALSPTSPLIIEVLAAFDRVDAVFFDQLDDLADAANSSTGSAARTLNTALKAIRDALAAAYARPILRRAEYIALMGPWHRALPAQQSIPAGIVTRTAAVEELLQALAPLSARCHDPESGRLFAKLAEAAANRDAEATTVAREAAWQRAISSARKRQWMLLRQTVHDTLNRACARCGSSRRAAAESAEAVESVRALCADAVCGVLMADALEPALMRTLVDPAAKLLPSPRTPASD
jgi:hypothetical protein